MEISMKTTTMLMDLDITLTAMDSGDLDAKGSEAYLDAAIAKVIDALGLPLFDKTTVVDSGSFEVCVFDAIVPPEFVAPQNVGGFAQWVAKQCETAFLTLGFPVEMKIAVKAYGPAPANATNLGDSDVFVSCAYRKPA